jgi:PAS domain S-box-containing protein
MSLDNPNQLMNINKRIKRWLITLTLILSWCGMAGVIAERHFEERVQSVVVQQRDITKNRVDDLRDSVRRNVGYLSGIPTMLSQLVRVNNATARFGSDVQASKLPLVQRKQQWTADAKFNDLSRYLQVVQTSLNTDLIFLTNAAGDTIAASNWGSDGSPIGNNFADRSWYLVNKSGISGFQYAVGRTTHIPGLYFASPVMQDGRYTGSVVVKVNLSNLSFLMSQTDAFLTDEYGVIILAHDKSLELQAMPDATVYALSVEARQSRYARSDFAARKLRPWEPHLWLGLFQRDNQEMPQLSESRTLSEFGLTIYVEDILSEIGGLKRERWLWFLLLAGLGSAIILGLISLRTYLVSMRQAKKQLQISETRYRTLAEWMPQSVIVHRDGQLIYVNQAALKLYGASSTAQMLGLRIEALIHPDSLPLAQARIRQNAMDGLPTPPIELRSIKLDGSIFDAEVRGINIDFDGSPAAFALISDITQRKRNRMLIDGQKQLLEMIATGLELPKVLAALVHFIESQSNEVLGSILLLDDDGVHLRHGAAPNLSQDYNSALDGAPIGPKAGSCGTAAYRKEPVYVEDIATDPLWSDYKLLALPEGLRACWSTPVFDNHQRVIATFAMYLRRVGMPQAEHLQLIETATHIATIAISSYRAEADLRKSELAFRTLFESSRDAFMTSSLEQGFIDGNQAALELFACPDKATFAALSPSDLSPEFQPDGCRSKDKADEMMQMALEQGANFFEWLHKRLNGKEFYAEVSLTRIEIEGKRMLHATVRDISQRKQVALQEQQRLDEIEALYQLSNSIGNATTLEEIYEVAQDYLLRLLGADRAAILLNDSANAMRFKASRGLSETYRQMVDGVSPWVAGTQNPQPIYIEDVVQQVNDARTLESLKQEGIQGLCCHPLMQHGQLLGKLMVCFDEPHIVTPSEMHLLSTIASHIAIAIDRKHAEQQFADMFEFAPDALVLTDMQATIIMLNHQAEILFGYSKQELIGQAIDVLIPKGRDEERRNMRQRFLNSAMRPRPLGGMSRKDLRGVAKDGRIFPVEISLSPMQSQNGMVIAAAIRDVSARQQVMEQLMLTAKELEAAHAQVEEERVQLATRVEERTAQLRIANRAKDSFLATMSHEIRTPLGGLLGMMELLSLTSLDADQIETLQTARNSGKGLLRIVDDILDWSKIEAGKLNLAPRPAAILPMLKGVAATYGPLASAKGIQLRYHLDESLRQAYLFDPLRLSQILNNFTSNAIKFTATGSVEVSAHLYSQQEGCDEVRFTVKDTGVGIDQVHLERLFLQYEQASADTARMYGGTGLGLSICRSLAELMEGNISVESRSGSGSTFSFTVRLPVANQATQRDMLLQDARGEEVVAQVEAQAIKLHHDGVSILVVDDHPVNRMLLKQQLEQLGLHADIAAYGIVALALWQTRHYDMVITDCHMPEMDGYELTRAIRDIELQDQRARTPIVAWTANVMFEEEGRCKLAGMDDLLTKPTELAQLSTLLRKWLPHPVQVSTEDDLIAPLAASATIENGTSTMLELAALRKIAKSHTLQVEMLQEFMLHNRNDIASLVAALQSGNPSEVARGAHRIKGACRMVGALQLATLCAAIEQAANLGDLNSARSIAKVLYEANSALENDVARFIAAP